jgi:hypothetical protein
MKSCVWLASLSICTTHLLLLANVGERFVYRPRLRLALMLRKVFHQLLLSFITIEEKFLPGSKRQTTNITIGHTWGVPNKSHDLQFRSAMTALLRIG